MKLEAAVHKRIVNPYAKPDNYEETVITTLYDMLTAEDAAIKLTQPQGFGKKPKLLRERDTSTLLIRGGKSENHSGYRNDRRTNGMVDEACGGGGVITNEKRPVINGIVGETLPIKDLSIGRVTSPDIEFYIAVVEKREDFEIARLQNQWFLSSCFAGAAQAFNVSID